MHKFLIYAIINEKIGHEVFLRLLRRGYKALDMLAENGGERGKMRSISQKRIRTVVL